MIKTRTKRITLNSNSIFIESGTYFWDLDMLFKEIENLPKYEYDPKNNILDSTFEADCTYYPSFTTNFLSFCLKYDKLPSINQLLTYYISENKIEKIGQYLCFENTKDKKKKKYNIDHVKNHIIRSYPSLIREFQIFIGLSFINRNGEGKIDFDVVYDTNYDNKGLDIVIEQKGKAIFGIKIYYDSNRSNGYYIKKQETKKDQVPVIDLKIRKDDTKILENNLYIIPENTILNLYHNIKEQILNEKE